MSSDIINKDEANNDSIDEFFHTKFLAFIFSIDLED